MAYILNTRQSFLLSCLLALLLVSFLKSSLVLAEEPSAEEWHYTLRPGDSVHEISHNLLSYQYTWNDVIKHNGVNAMANLAPGSIVKIPMHWLKHQPKPAFVKQLAGSAQIKKASSSRYNTLKQGMMIQVGDEVATKDGNILIEFADGSTIRLEPNSNLVFNKLSHFGKTGMVDTRLRLKNGSLTTDIPPLVKGSRYEIRTPSAVAAVRGTEFRLHTTEDETRLEVLEGTVEFSGAQGEVLVSEGSGASIKRGSPRIEVIDLPDPPKTQFAKQTLKELPATIAWDKAADATEYQVQLSQDNLNGKRIQQFSQTDNNLEIDQINNGDYALSIRSVDAEGFKGNDAVSQLTVEVDAVKAELIAPNDNAIFEMPTPTFVWNYPNLEGAGNKAKNTLSKLEIAIDKDFAALVTSLDYKQTNSITLQQELIPNRYFWRVSSITNNTQITYSEPRQIHIKGWLPEIKILSVNYLDKQVGLFWSPVANTAGYILQISDTRDFSKVLKEEKLSKPRAHLLLNPGQKYYARVKGMGDELYSSKFGPVQDIFIAPK